MGRKGQIMKFFEDSLSEILRRLTPYIIHKQLRRNTCFNDQTLT
jgi:hypothetical protein